MKKYLYLRAWCRLLGSTRAYTQRAVAQAKAEHAPETAIFKRATGGWATFEGIQREDTKCELQAIVDEMTGGGS